MSQTFKSNDIIRIKRCTCGSGLGIFSSHIVKNGAETGLYVGDTNKSGHGYCICEENWRLIERVPKAIVKAEWLKKVEFQSRKGWLITNDSVITPDGKKYTHKEFTDLYNDYRAVMRKLLTLKKNKEL